MESRAGNLSWFALFALGCAPGEEVAKLGLRDGETEQITVAVKAGQEIHFWEDFEYHATGEKTFVKRRRCRSWEITAKRDGADAQKLSCWALEGSRCDSVSGRTRYTNCQVHDCVLKVDKSGELAIEAKLKEVEDCGMSGTSTLRVRRVSM